MKTLKEYKREFTVQYHETDFRGEARLSTILRYGQQIAMEHCDKLGIGHDFMQTLNKVFLLAKIRGTVHRMPRGGECLQVRTIPYTAVRAQYQRLIYFYDEAGELIISLDTRWLMVDTETKRIVRKMPQELEGWFNEPDGLEDFRLPKCEEIRQAGEIRVRYSQMDINHHLNNTVYADLLCDALEEQIMQGESNPIKEFMIVYHNEAKLGDVIAMHIGRNEEGWLCEGGMESGSCFAGFLKLRE